MEQQILTPSGKKERVFISNDTKMDDWASLSPFYDDLLQRAVNNLSDFEHWLADKDELESAISEYAARLYISMTCDTTDKNIEEKYLHFVDQVEANLFPVSQKINKRIVVFSEIAGVDKIKYLT